MRTRGLVVEAVLLERLHAGVNNGLTDHVVRHPIEQEPLNLELLAAIMDLKHPIVNPVLPHNGDIDDIVA